MAVAQAGIHPPDEMPFGIAWTTVPSPEFERGFLQHHWRPRAHWAPESWHLNLMVELDGLPIGAQSHRCRGVRRPSDGRTPDRGSAARTRARGYGKEMRAAVLALRVRRARRAGRRDRGIPRQRAPRTASRASLGYEENGRGSLAPEGVSRETQRFRMTAEGWRSRPRPPIEIEGLDAVPATCSAPDPHAQKPPPAAAATAARRAAARSRHRRSPDDDGELPIVPSADIIPPMSGMPEFEKSPPPLPAGGRRA